jgi:Tol biopolymer transport system component
MLAYTSNTPFATHLVWTDVRGKHLSDIPMVPGKYVEVDLSPDGRHAVLVSSNMISASDVWIADLERGVVTRLSYEAGQNADPRWSPDGTHVAYSTAPYGGAPSFHVVNIGAGGSTETYLADDPAFKWIYDWTPDGRALVYGRQESATRRDIWILPLDGDRTPRPYLVTPYYEEGARVSPDGRWMAYNSDESGQAEAYVQAFPAGGAKYQVTTRGGFNAGWTSDGRRLFFGEVADPSTIFAAEVISGSQFRLGPARVFGHVPDTVFDAELARGEERALMLIPARPLPPQTITIVQNWPSLLAK